MKTCAVCNIHFSDGVQCTSCNKHLDFGCARISEGGWKKLGVDRRAQWKCPACRISSPAVTPSEPASVDMVLSEIRDLKRQLLSLPTLIEDIQIIKNELSQVKATCESSITKLDEYGSRLSEVETKVNELQKVQDTVNDLQMDLGKMKFEFAAQEQRSRLNNVEIKGVPAKKGENLFSIMDAIGRRVGYNCQKAQINYISRVPIYNSNDKLIIVSFLNRYVKEDFISAARAHKELSASEIGFQGASQRVYVNDHLSVDYKKLLSRVKVIAKEKNYQFVWVKHGKIHLLKNQSSKVIIIRKDSDLNKIA